MTLQKRKLDHKWLILAACFLMTFTSLGFCSSNKGLFLSAITDALNIPRSLFSIKDSTRYITSALMNLCFGFLIGKFGVRKLVAFGFLMLSACMFVDSVASNVLHFYASGAMLGLGLAFTTGTMTSAIIRRWFKKDIGKYTGIVYAANGLGGALAAQIVSPMINEIGNPFGYRNAYRLVACVMLIAGIVIVAMLREHPEDETQTTYEETSQKRGRGWVGIPYARAIRNPVFYLAGATVFFTGFMLQGIGSAYIPHLTDIGFDTGYIANISSFSSVLLTCSKLTAGGMYDKLGLRTVMLVCQSSGVLAFSVLLFIVPSQAGIVLAVVYSVLKTIALPLETLMIPLIVHDLFGDASADKILGMFLALNYAGYALGEPLINLCYDVTGSYIPVFAICTLLMLALTVLFQFVLKLSQKNKDLIAQRETLNA